MWPGSPALHSIASVLELAFLFEMENFVVLSPLTFATPRSSQFMLGVSGMKAMNQYNERLVLSKQ